MNSVEWIAFAQGVQACRECAEGEKVKPNPYPVGSGAFKAWNKGWNQRMEQSKGVAKSDKQPG